LISGQCKQRSTSTEEIAEWAESEPKVKNSHFKPAFVEYHISPTRFGAGGESLLSQVMTEVLGTFIIPYDHSKRKKMLGRAFERLAKYIESHREALEQQKRAQPRRT
jgi:hypothetical protein